MLLSFLSGNKQAFSITIVRINRVKIHLLFFQANNHHLTEYPTYHTLYDNFNYVTKFIDPDFRYHTLIAKIWLLYTVEVADARILPFNITRSADKLFSDVKMLEKDFRKMSSSNNVSLGQFSFLKTLIQDLIFIYSYLFIHIYISCLLSLQIQPNFIHYFYDIQFLNIDSPYF